MARGNQRDKAREANLKKMAGQVRPPHSNPRFVHLSQILKPATEERKRDERVRAPAR